MKILVTIIVVQLVNVVAFITLNRITLLRMLAARNQLKAYLRQHKKPRPQIRTMDRLYWVILSRIWKQWSLELIMVKPSTVIRWQKRKFRDWWKKKSKGNVGRPPIPQEHIAFIKKISSDHPEYGEDRIALELKEKFGIHHSPTTVGKYMVRISRKPKDQKWKTFLKNQAKGIWCCDFFVEATLRFEVVYIFVIMELASRKVVYFKVTDYPTLPWIKQQIRNTLLEHEEPKFLIHDNDRKFGQFGKSRVIKSDYCSKPRSCRSAFDGWLWEIMGIRGIPTPYNAPNANAHMERLIGTLRRECLDHMLIWNERHLCKILAEFICWYNTGRVNQGIPGIPHPEPSLPMKKPKKAKLVARPILNGLHHDYRLAA